MKKRIDNPCYVDGVDCPDRKAACQVDCERWKSYVELRNQQYLDNHNSPEHIMSCYLCELRQRILDCTRKK